MIVRLRVRILAGAAREFSSPELTLCADSYLVSVPPCVAAVAQERPQSLCQKCRWRVTSKHAYTLHLTNVCCSHIMPGQQHSQPTQTLLVKCVCVFKCNLPPALWVEWPASFTCHCGNTGMERTLNKSQHTKLTLEKKIILPFLLGFERATFRLRVRRSANELSR